MKTFIAAFLVAVAFAQDEAVEEENFPKQVGQKSPWSSHDATDENRHTLSGELWTVESEQGVFSFHVSGNLGINRSATTSTYGYSWFQLSEIANVNTDAAAAALQADYDLFFITQRSATEPKDATYEFDTKFTSTLIDVEEAYGNERFESARSGNFGRDAIAGSWVDLKAAQSENDKVNNKFSFSWEVGRPFEAATFNLKLATKFSATVGSAFADATNGRPLAKAGQPTVKTIEVEIVEGAATLAAGALAVAAVLSF